MRCDSAPAARTTDTYKPKEIQERFTWDVVIPNEDRAGNERKKNAVALLDTQSERGNWITKELFNKIKGNTYKSLSRDADDAPVETPLGLMHSVGTTAIEMRRLEGNKYFEVPFRVGSSRKPQGYEMILGRDFINKNKILKVDRGVLLPNLASDKITPSEQVAMAALEEQRRLQREKLAANGGR